MNTITRLPIRHVLAALSNTALLACALGAAAPAQAAPGEVVATITQMQGMLYVQRGDSKWRLGLNSKLLEGDLLMTQPDTFVRLKFSDRSELVLGPEALMKLTEFTYRDDAPAQDKVLIELIKGGFRAASGRIGRRNREAVHFEVPMASISVRATGTHFGAQYCHDDCGNLPTASGLTPANGLYLDLVSGNIDVVQKELTEASAAPEDLLRNSPTSAGPLAVALIAAQANVANVVASGAPDPGLNVQVLDGMINLSNKGGTQNFSAGQFGYSASPTTPPTVVPKSPGIQFTPPPTFSSTTGSKTGSGASKAAAVDCEVR